MRLLCIVDALGQKALLAGLSLAVAGCNVLPVEEVEALRARDRGEFDVAAYVAKVWPQRAVAEIRSRAVTVEALRTSPEALGSRFGNRAGDGSPWTFAVRGDGIVRSVDRESPRGRMAVDTSAGPVALQIGPVVSGSTIRDAMPSIVFNDFPDQISFAEVGMALTERSLIRLRTQISAVRPGDRIRFLGTASVSESDGPLTLTPVEMVVGLAR